MLRGRAREWYLREEMSENLNRVWVCIGVVYQQIPTFNFPLHILPSPLALASCCLGISIRSISHIATSRRFGYFYLSFVASCVGFYFHRRRPWRFTREPWRCSITTSGWATCACWSRWWRTPSSRTCTPASYTTRSMWVHSAPVHPNERPHPSYNKSLIVGWVKQ